MVRSVRTSVKVTVTGSGGGISSITQSVVGSQTGWSIWTGSPTWPLSGGAMATSVAGTGSGAPTTSRPATVTLSPASSARAIPPPMKVIHRPVSSLSRAMASSIDTSG